MPTCPRCNGEGSQLIEEAGRQVNDACYHCGTTGQVSEEQLRADNVQGLVSQLAGILCSDAEKDCKSHPDGEDWSFHAAENMCSLQEYRQGRLVQFEMEVAERMTELDKASPDVMDALLRLTDR